MTGIRAFRIGTAYGRGDFETVIGMCDEALAKNPQDGFAMSMLAQSQTGLGKHREALEAAERALQILPDSFEMLRLATDLAFHLNEHSRARAFAARALAAPGSSALPRSLRWSIPLAARVPVLRSWFNAERVAELDAGHTERDADQWRAWAASYLESRTDNARADQIG